jgi:hypothetical protein
MISKKVLEFLFLSRIDLFVHFILCGYATVTLGLFLIPWLGCVYIGAALSAGFVSVAGIFKEALDERFGGKFDWLDVLYNNLGVLTAALFLIVAFKFVIYV